MMLSLSKWWQTIRIAWSKFTAYRMNFFLQVLGPTLVFFFIKYNLWSAIYSPTPGAIIQGYNFDQMIQYHIWAMIVGLIAQGHTAMNLSEEIRLGKISAYLIYPFNFWEFHTAHFLAFQGLQVCISFLTIVLISSFGLMNFPPFELLLFGYLYCLFVSLFWFTLQYLTGILGFWLEETWILRVILQIGTGFLSGAILPLDLYPEKFVAFLQYTPFPYLTYYPIKIFTGQFTDYSTAYFIIAFWIGILAFINHLIWKRGIKLYTAAGM